MGIGEGTSGQRRLFCCCFLFDQPGQCQVIFSEAVWPFSSLLGHHLCALGCRWSSDIQLPSSTTPWLMVSTQVSIMGSLGPRLWWLLGKPPALNSQLPPVTLSKLTWEPYKCFTHLVAAEGDWGGLSQVCSRPRSALHPFLLYFSFPYPEFSTGGRTTSALSLGIPKPQIHHIPWGFNS